MSKLKKAAKPVDGSQENVVAYLSAVLEGAARDSSHKGVYLVCDALLTPLSPENCHIGDLDRERRAGWCAHLADDNFGICQAEPKSFERYEVETFKTQYKHRHYVW